LPKPASGLFGGRFSEILADRLRRVGRNNPAPRSEPVIPAASISLRDVRDWNPTCIAIGASTGGIHAINDFLAALPARIGVPIFVTQHLPPLFMPYFARQLAVASGRSARVVENDDPVLPDHIHVAPGHAHLRLVRRGTKTRVFLDSAPAPSGCLPSVDPMLDSVAQVYGRGAVAVLLSGMGRDGLIGSGRLVKEGGVVIAQDQYSSAIWGMPGAVAQAGLCSAVLPPRELARRLVQCSGDAGWK
jgi:two-component system chemotaxis response regulator CheB